MHAPDAEELLHVSEDAEDAGAHGWGIVAVFSGVYGFEYFVFPTLVDRENQCPPTSPLGVSAYTKSRKHHGAERNGL